MPTKSPIPFPSRTSLEVAVAWWSARLRANLDRYGVPEAVMKSFEKALAKAILMAWAEAMAPRRASHLFIYHDMEVPRRSRRRSRRPGSNPASTPSTFSGGAARGSPWTAPSPCASTARG